MPLLSASHLPEPTNWQDLEILCVDLWRKEWADDNVQRHGRSGQTQQGVDVSGRDQRGEMCGIQCKCIEPSRVLTEDEIDEEVKKAKTFEPPLKHFLIVTTGKKDSPTELYCRKISYANLIARLFDVTYVAWSDVCSLFQAFPEVARIHYPYAIYSVKPLALGNEKTLEWKECSCFFDREPFIHPRIVEELKGYMSDSDHTIVSVDLLEANDSNRFFRDFTVEDIDGVPLVGYSTPPEHEFEKPTFFDYRPVAVTPSGTFIVWTRDGGGGSGVFHNLLFFSLQQDMGIRQHYYEVKVKQRVLLKILGSVSLGDRYYGKVMYSNGVLDIGGVPKQEYEPHAERKAYSIEVS
jgi:hypothetical protein